MRSLSVLGLLAMLLLTALCAAPPASALADTVDEQTRAIAKQLQCPICNGSTVADSPSDLAAQMRAVIRQKVEAGESRDQIIQYFVDRYGDSILMEPPRRGFGLWVWLAPIVILAIGAVILTSVLRGWVRPRRQPEAVPIVVGAVHRNGTAHAEAGEVDSTLERVQHELDRFRRDG